MTQSKSESRIQAAQEFSLVNGSNDLSWVNREEAVVLRDAEREVYGTPEDLVRELMQGVREIRKSQDKEN